MRIPKTALLTGAMIGAIVAGTFAASSASAASYVVCNRYGECWKVHEKYKEYPADVGIVFHDDAWYATHEHDTHFRWLADPNDDHGWYDKDGVWHPFAP